VSTEADPAAESGPPGHMGPVRLAFVYLRDRLRSPFASSMGIMTIAMAASLLLQMLTFAIVARSMGPHQFGAFATVAALVLIVGSF